MEKLELTPETLAPYRFASRPLRITFQKRIISISGALATKLSLKKGDRFIIEIEDNKLYLKISVTDKGFKIASVITSGVCNAGATGILYALYKNKIVTDTEQAAVFELGEFKEGRYHLKPVEKTNKGKR